MSKWLPVKSMSPLNSPKRPRRDDDDDSDGSHEPLEGSSSSTKTPEELKAITWKMCEPVPVNIDGDGSIAATGNTVYVNPEKSSTLYGFNTVEGEWINSIECDRTSFGLAVIDGDLTLVGGKSLEGSNLNTLTSLVGSGSSMKWIQKYLPMSTCEGRVTVCSNDEHLLVANVFPSIPDHLFLANPPCKMEIMDVKTKKWKSVKFHGQITSMTLLGDRVYVLSSRTCTCNVQYCTVSTCSLSALSFNSSSAIVQPLVWHKVCPILDLFWPSLANLNGNLVAVGGMKSANTYSDSDGRDREQYSWKPALYVYSNESSRFDSGDWKFVSNLPARRGYPDADFLVASHDHGHRLIVCGGIYHSYDSDNDIHLQTTDIVHIGFLE